MFTRREILPALACSGVLAISGSAGAQVKTKKELAMFEMRRERHSYTTGASTNTKIL
jgi:hypothetical protein